MVQNSFFVDSNRQRVFLDDVIARLDELAYERDEGKEEKRSMGTGRSVTYAYFRVNKGNYQAPSESPFRKEFDIYEVKENDYSIDISVSLAHLKFKGIDRKFIIKLLMSKLGLDNVPKTEYHGFILFPVTTTEDLGSFRKIRDKVPQDGVYIRMYFNLKEGKELFYKVDRFVGNA